MGRIRGGKGYSVALRRMPACQEKRPLREILKDGEYGAGSVVKRFYRQSSNGLGGGFAPDHASLTVVEIGAFRKNVAVLRSGFCDFNVLTS